MEPAKPPHDKEHGAERTHRYRTRGVDVEIRESEGRVELILDGHPIGIGYHDGRYSSHLANMFKDYDSVEEIVDELLTNEGKTWSLHGDPDDTHRHDEEPGHDDHPAHDEEDGHDHGPGGHEHGHRGGQR